MRALLCLDFSNCINSLQFNITSQVISDEEMCKPQRMPEGDHIFYFYSEQIL